MSKAILSQQNCDQRWAMTGLVSANDTKQHTIGDRSRSLAGRFEQQVSLHGARIAVKTDKQILTDDQLNRAANRLAREICAQEGKRQAPVGLAFKTGINLITATIAALKCGKPFVQLDSRLPQDRRTKIVENAEASVVVTDAEQASRARDWISDGIRLIDIDRLADQPDANLPAAVQPEQLAYIHY